MHGFITLSDATSYDKVWYNGREQATYPLAMTSALCWQMLIFKFTIVYVFDTICDVGRCDSFKNFPALK